MNRSGARLKEQQSHVENRYRDRNNSNKKHKLWVFIQPFATNKLLNSTVETHHKLHVFDSLEFLLPAAA